MPTTTIALPESYLPWIEKRRAELGIKSKHAFILAAIAAMAGVPEIIKPAAEMDDSSTWPFKNLRCICPACKRGEHCNGLDPMIVPIKARRVRERFECVCSECVGGSLDYNLK